MTPPVGPVSHPSFPPSGDSNEKLPAGMTRQQFDDTVDGVTFHTTYPGAMQTQTPPSSSDETSTDYKKEEVKYLTKQTAQEAKHEREQTQKAEKEDEKRSLGG